MKMAWKGFGFGENGWTDKNIAVVIWYLLTVQRQMTETFRNGKNVEHFFSALWPSSDLLQLCDLLFCDVRNISVSIIFSPDLWSSAVDGLVDCRLMSGRLISRLQGSHFTGFCGYLPTIYDFSHKNASKTLTPTICRHFEKCKKQKICHFSP